MGRVRRAVVGCLAFYALAATFMVATTALHEYSHYAAREGPGIPDIRFEGSHKEADSALVYTDRVTVGRTVYEVENVEETVIVFYPNTLRHAFSLGLLPAEKYPDGGILASTYLHTDRADYAALAAGSPGSGQGVLWAPIIVALSAFGGALLWTLLRPNLANRSLLYAYAGEVYCSSHHAAEVGMDRGTYMALADIGFILAWVLVILLSRTAREMIWPGRFGSPAPSPAPTPPTVPGRPRPTPGLPAAARTARPTASAPDGNALVMSHHPIPQILPYGYSRMAARGLLDATPRASAPLAGSVHRVRTADGRETLRVYAPVQWQKPWWDKPEPRVD